MKKIIEFRNQLYTIPRKEWNGAVRTQDCCPPMVKIFNQLMRVGKESLTKASIAFPLKKEGQADDILVAMMADDYSPSKTTWRVISKGNYKIIHIEGGSPSRLSEVTLMQS